MQKVIKLVVQLLLTAALASGMLAQANGAGNKDKPEAVQAGVAASSADYVIGADDTLHISVWKEPDLTASLPVRPDGKISLPLLNDIPAAGLTPMLQALSAAGFTQFANVKNVYLLRTENGRQVKLPFNYKDVVKGNHPEQNIMLKPGDTVVVP